MLGELAYLAGIFDHQFFKHFALNDHEFIRIFFFDPVFSVPVRFLPQFLLAVAGPLIL